MAVRARAEAAGLADLDAGISGSSTPLLFSPRYGGRRVASSRALGSSPSPRSGGARFFGEPSCDDEPHHFLDACFLCKKPIGGNRDIFMYRGDTPFCSEECRQEQIEMDEAKERMLSIKTSRKEHQHQHQKQKSKAQQSIQPRVTGTVVAG